ncbi:IS200 family transposase [Streptococcus suis R61]|uniref:IS200 family transposase n=1 Tax=Streptococcus suis R61 TaxID=996306 RepID=A0AA87K405_STRSU|nr:IS200/IS605 family transposase [Streptococcus suis]EHC01968.1 IS200 family transposase [Streptococcus suis R61]
MSSHLSIDEKLSIINIEVVLERYFDDCVVYKGVEIIEGHLMPDHVHMLVSIPPRLSVSSFMGYLKGKSALMMFDKHANLSINLVIVISGQRDIM